MSNKRQIVECVPNFSEGRNMDIINQITDVIRRASGVKLLDVDPGEATNRTVVTFVGDPDSVVETAFQAVKKAGQLIDMRQHHGAHPRMGATDVCPLIPVAGINFGRLGFLTTSGADKVSALLRGEFTTEKRPLLQVDTKNLPDGFYPYALNEFAVQRKGPAVLELDLKVNGTPIPRYMADGVLVASATGSTAYSLSAGGPVVMPGCKTLIIVPIAPHNLNIRPLVVSDTSSIEVSFSTRYKDATLSADNRSFSLPDGASATFTSSDAGIELVSADNDFMQALSSKLYWGADWRNS